MKVYKIRNKKGEFSSGGQCPSWSNRGKVWRNKGGLSSHLSLVRDGFYNGCEILEYETIESLVIPVETMMEDKKLKKAERDRKYKELENKYKKEKERKLLAELKSKYENE